ncbi:MAG: hypothetical protein JEY91_07585 [Spirochaetaceae bacterium]|nr:hypothetical protein [Spirochaetaceae bacterium]
MFELLIVGAAIFFGGIYLFKFIFFLLGILLTSVGFIIKAVLTLVLAVLFFPFTLLFTGGILSGGLVGILLICALLGALSYKRVEEKRYY